jgi:hypothetical protein
MIPADAVVARIVPPGTEAQLQAAQAQVDYNQRVLQRDGHLFRDG